MSFTVLLDRFTAAVKAGDGSARATPFIDDGVYHDTFYGAFCGAEAVRDMPENHFWCDAKAFRWDMIDPVEAGGVGYARFLFSYASKLPSVEGYSCLYLADEDSGLKIRYYGEMFDQGVPLTRTGFVPARVVRPLAKEAGRLRARVADMRHLKG